MYQLSSQISAFLNRNRHSISIAWYFEMIGIVMGNWVARIPDVKLEHKLSDWLFGVVLLCCILGGLLSFPIVGTVVDIYGSKVGILLGSVSIIILTPILGFPYKSIYILAVGLAGLGFGWGILEVTANTQASLLEKTSNQHWLGYFQANFSIGCLIGALLGGSMANSNISPFDNFLIIDAIILPTVYLFQFGLFTRQEEIQSNQNFKAKYGSIQSCNSSRSSSSSNNNNSDYNSSNNQHHHVLTNNGLNDKGVMKMEANHDYNIQILTYNATTTVSATMPAESLNKVSKDYCLPAADNKNTFSSSSSSFSIQTSSSSSSSSSSSWTPMTELYPLCGIAIVAAMAEGSVSDWSTIFMTSHLHMPAVIAATGFALFSLMVALGRLASDYLRQHWNNATLIQLSGCLGFSGLTLFSLSDIISPFYQTRVCASYMGLIIAGAGLSVCSPIIISIAGKLPNIEPTQAIAIITTPVYLGYLVGPPLFGFLSYAFDGLNWALLFGACLILLIPLFAMFITNVKRSDDDDDDDDDGYRNGYRDIGSDQGVNTSSSSS